MTKILLLEDDISLIDGLEYALRKNDFDVNTVRTVSGALEHLMVSGEYDLLLLDVTLPDGTGFEVCEKMRAGGSQIPIIFLTASDEEVNVIRGLDGGGDDYITKPFKIGELCSRIRALLRRPCNDRRDFCGTDAGRIAPARPAYAKCGQGCHQRSYFRDALGQYGGFCG